MDETKDKRLTRQVTKDIQTIINLYMDLSSKIEPLEADLNDMKGQVERLRGEVAKLEAKKEELIEHNGDYISRAEGIKAIEKESTERLERIDATRKEVIKLREELDKESKTLDDKIAEDKRLIEIIEINTNPIHFYVRGLQELFDKRGIIISVIDELKKIGKRPY